MGEFNRPTAKRFALAVLVAVIGAVLLTIFAAPAEAQVYYPNLCKGLTPSDWQYWQLSCWAY